MDALVRYTRRIAEAPKGIVAIDTDGSEIGARFRTAGLMPTERMTRAFRRMILQAPALADYASGVVLRPDDLDMPVGRTTAADLLRRSDILVGVRVDTGHELGFGAADRITSGLDGLTSRLTRFRESGAQFALWSVCTGLPPAGVSSLTVNSQAAARFARTCQTLDMVPVVRVGGRMPAGSPQTRRAALAAALLSVLGHLEDLEVDLARVVVNTMCETGPPNAPFSGSPLSMLPQRVGGVALSAVDGSGKIDGDPPAALQALVAAAPWPVTFYIGRDATVAALRAWGGQPSAIPAGQRALADRLAYVSDRLLSPPHPAGRQPDTGPERPGLAKVAVLPMRPARSPREQG
jgi:fructose-bisphosphate aldolase class I